LFILSIASEDHENLEIEQTRGHLSSAICSTLYSFIGSLSSKKKPPKQTTIDKEETAEIKGDLSAKMLDLDSKPVTVELVEGTLVEGQEAEVKLPLDLGLEGEIKSGKECEEICSPKCSDGGVDIMEDETIDEKRVLAAKDKEKVDREANVRENELKVTTKESTEGHEEEIERTMKTKATELKAQEEGSPLNFVKPVIPSLSEENIEVEGQDNNAIEGLL